MNHSNRWRTLLGSAGLVALSMGAPNACMDVKSEEVVKAGTGTWDDPTIVRRDNLAVGGELTINDKTVTSTVSSTYLTDGRWKNFSGHFDFEEIRENFFHYVDQYTPILPRENFVGPGQAKYGTRSGLLVHGNKYLVKMNGSDRAGESFALQKYVKLSDDTLVVPLVVVSWAKTGDETYHFEDHRHNSTLMFDYNFLNVTNAKAPAPYWRPDNTKMTPQPLLGLYPLTLASVDVPDANLFQLPPDAIEDPADDIWEACNIQFQVIGEFVLELPKDWSLVCKTQSFELPEPAVVGLPAALAGTPVLRDYLINDLQPIYVSYADLAECAGDYAPDPHFGSTPGKGSRIEITFRRPRTITSHELGHALGLDHLEDAQGAPVEGNLMRVNPVKGERKLTAEQCTEARKAALGFSMRFDAFNRNTGRTYSATPPLPPTTKVGTSTGDITFGQVEICCVGATDAVLSPPGSCPGKEVAIEQCQLGCCSGSKATLYACTQAGGTFVDTPCPPK